MCIAIFKPANKTIKKENLEQCFKSNPDGCGFLRSTGKEVKISKGFFDFDSFYEEYVKYENEQMLIHFRIKTHGEIHVENCHPFYVNNQLGFIHNGIISHHSGDVKVSDTRKFNREIIKPLVRKFTTDIIFTKEFVSLVDEYIGYSKLVFMDNTGRYQIFNEDKGYWDEDIWYSNTSYKIIPKRIQSNLDDDSYYSYDGFPTYPKKSVVYPHKIEYYLDKPGNNRIWAGDYAKVLFNNKGVESGTLVKVTYISKTAMCDIRLGDGTILPNFPGECLQYISYKSQGNVYMKLANLE